MSDNVIRFPIERTRKSAAGTKEVVSQAEAEANMPEWERDLFGIFRQVDELNAMAKRHADEVEEILRNSRS